ncbi:GIY-YIG nuclease family protein [Paenibacillus albus]|uniref:GIY-YIG nuclease family protein n=1 Tax=Paenibacillus albus TaxID=2495582 RepID=A0A3Q8X704_9BACL|nr:GIY-YIG nuclease family protein [Paenibacillus albus]AZN40780.1 GIY-YIG nuclease family protein [Paenibacillus albus]
MDKEKRKELLEAYKEIKTIMGVVQITNTVNGKLFIDSYPNLKNKWMTIKMQLDTGRFANAQLQKDWKEQGEGAFTFEELDRKDAAEVKDIKWELKVMKKLWLEKLQPYGDRGYNRPE